MRRINVTEYDRAPQQIKLALFDVMSNPNVREGRLGYDTIDAVETAQSLNAPLTPQAQQVKKIVSDWTAALRTSDLTWSSLKPAEQHAKAQAEIVRRVTLESGNIPDSGGLYSAPSLAATGKIPAVGATKLWKENFAALALASPQLPTSAQSMFDAAANAVVTGKMSPEQAAAEISTIYTAIAMDNTQQRNYNLFALPAQNLYRTAVDTGTGIFRGRTVVDFMSAPQVQRELVRRLAQERNRSAPNPLSSPPMAPLMPPHQE